MVVSVHLEVWYIASQLLPAFDTVLVSFGSATQTCARVRIEDDDSLKRRLVHVFISIETNILYIRSVSDVSDSFLKFLTSISNSFMLKIIY